MPSGTFAGAREEFALLIPPTAFTWCGFRQWVRSPEIPSTCRLSFIDGAIFIDASPQRLNSHIAVRGALMAGVGGYVRDRELGLWISGRVPVSNEGAALSTEPDRVFVAYESLRSGGVRLVPTPDGEDADELEGTPDLVCEVIGPTTEHRDNVSLRASYHRAGIPEFWLIDVRGDELAVDVPRREPDGYGSVPMVDGWLTSPILGGRFRLERVRSGSGLFAYEFQVGLSDGAPA